MRLLFLFFVSVNIFSQDISDNLLVNYAFEGNVNDVSGQGNHAVNFGATFVMDRFGNPNSAIYFDGLDDYIEFPNISELKPDLPVSFSFWINYDSNDWEDREVFNTSFEEDRNTGIFFNSQASTGNYGISYGDGSYSYVPSTRRTYVSNSSIEVGNWHQIVIIVSSANDMKIYFDCNETGGVYSGTGGPLQYSDLPGCIGRHDRELGSPANYFKGAIDDFRYWDRELTLEEVDYLCDTNLSVSEIKFEKDVIVYPNPTSGFLHIESNSSDIHTISIYNFTGQKVLNSRFSPKLDLKFLPSGIYYLGFYKNDNLIKWKKIIVD